MYQYFKRAIDILFALLLLIFASIPMVIVAIAIKLEDGGPIIYKSKRMGKGLKTFNTYKFRSMKTNREELHSKLSHEQMVTKVGKFIRKTSLDELPQLFNVLKGEMSFIGPRPWIPEYYEWFTEEQKKRVDVLPGISGLAQAKGRNGINIFNVGAIRNFISDFPEMYREYYDEADDAKIANMFAIYEILYRCMQMMQRLGITGNCELDKMYYDLYAYIDSLPPSILKKYIRKNKGTAMDRNVRIAAFKEISELLTLSNIHMISTLQYLYYLGVGYRDCVISPMAHEYERLGREYKYDFSALSFIDGLENGVLEDAEKIDKALLMIDEAFNDKKSSGSVYYALRRE